MARVNDPPPPPESLEVLRRRFTRQNKDIIRSNLTQAQRIHGLEAEVSRLLAENISLKQALITEKEEVARLRHSHHAGQQLSNIQAQLQNKFSEANALLEQLVGRPRGVEHRNEQVSTQETNQKKVTISTPTREAWERRKSFTAALQEQDGRLPAINETKPLDEPEDGQQLIEQDNAPQTDSPEIGPPPVARFEQLEAPTNAQDDSAAAKKLEEEVPKVNFERRRKRRTSSLISEMEVADVATEVAASTTEPEVQELPRASAKRKLDASELEIEDQTKAAIASSKENFVYHRRPALKPALGARKSSRFNRPLNRLNQTQHAASLSPQKESRKALAPKSANSPTKKTMDSKVIDKSKDGGETSDVRRSTTRVEYRSEQDASSERPPTRGKSSATEESTDNSRKPSRSRISILSEKETESGSDPEAAPKTPFIPDDMLSPPSSKPSGPANGRTIQEAVIMNSVEDVLNGSIGRGSRRAKAAVSYAEPNLRDKMRRPGQLVGAVEGYERKAKEGTLDAEHLPSCSTSEDIDSSRQHSRWVAVGPPRAEPGSPLREKQTANEKRKRETLNLQAWASRESQAPQSALPASQLNDRDRAPVERGMEGLSIFDHPVSSPSGREATDNSSLIEVKAAPSTDSRRRTVGRASANDSASSEPPAAAALAPERRRSLQPTSSSLPSSKTLTSRHSLNPSSHRSSATTSTSRTSSGLSKRSTADPEPYKPTVAAKSRPPTSLVRHRRSTSDAAKPSAPPISVESNISNSDVEDESDYEASHLSAAAPDGIDNSMIRTTRRRSMLV